MSAPKRGPLHDHTRQSYSGERLGCAWQVPFIVERGIHAPPLLALHLHQERLDVVAVRRKPLRRTRCEVGVASAKAPKEVLQSSEQAPQWLYVRMGAQQADREAVFREHLPHTARIRDAAPVTEFAGAILVPRYVHILLVRQLSLLQQLCAATETER